MSLKLLLCDQDPQVLDAWKLQFAKRPEVNILEGDPLETPADALLLPGNSFGFLDRGIGLRAVETFGWEIQDELRDRIRRDFAGELLVGQAIVVRLPSVRPIVYAPIWRTPQALTGTVNVFLAVRGAFLALGADPTWGEGGVVAAPGMGVGAPGELDAKISARQIRYAYEMATEQRGLGDKNLTQLTRRQHKLQSVPTGGIADDSSVGPSGPAQSS